MTQAELNQAVAKTTGESLGTIRRHGFSVVAPLQIIELDYNDEGALPNVVDWDALERDQRRFAA